MPGLTVLSDLLLDHLKEKEITDEQLSELLDSYGLEYDSYSVVNGKIFLKIEIPANRPDLLSVENLAIALNTFRGSKFPQIQVIPPTLQFDVDASVLSVRPHFVCAVLRGVNFTQENYDSFIDFQDKLHHNLCRKRSLASIGTHDLNTIEGPFKYLAQKPEDIIFVPLFGGEEVNGRQLFDKLRAHAQLSKYLSLIEDFPIWPVVRDHNDVVLSLPPILNSFHSKISLKTQDILIECTATDETRANVSVVVLSYAFSVYSSTPFTIEQVQLNFPDRTVVTPNFSESTFDVDLSYIQNLTGLAELDKETTISLLSKMMLQATIINDKIRVIAPAIRSDVLHPCDIGEDIAIAFGYNKIKDQIKNKLPSGIPLSFGEFSDRLRREIVASSYNEVLSFSLCSIQENYTNLLLEDDHCAVRIKKAKTIELEIVRTSLISGLLKINRKIQDKPKRNIFPLRLFEISDVVLKNEKSETRARNERRLCATIADHKSRFEHVHGLLDRVGILTGKTKDLKLVREDSPTCIPGQRARIELRGKSIGWIGVIHPQVLINFDMVTPVAALEVEIESLF